jgi:ABC-type amino acid transport substrate-binding protein
LRKLMTLAGLVLLLIVAAAAARAQVTDPDEIADTLERSKARNKLMACADPYNFPYAAQDSDPAGFDVEIMREIAKRGGMRLEMVWADTGTRGGTSRAFRNSILKKRCDVFLGLSDSGDGDDDMLMGQLAFTKPYLGLGYVLVVQGKAEGMKSIAELKKANIKVGVTNEVPRALFLDNRRIMESMAKGELDASLVWATAIAVAHREYPNVKFRMVEGYVPEAAQRWNMNFVVRKQDKPLMEFINDGISELLSNGRMKQIVESYGVPFYPPFS